MDKSFARQVASAVLHAGPEWHEPAATDARWEALKEYLRDRIDAEVPVMEGFRGEITGAASGGMVSAMRSTLAEMKKLEASR